MVGSVLSPALLGGLAGEAEGVADLGPGCAGLSGGVGGVGEFGFGVGGGLSGGDESGEFEAGDGAWCCSFADGGAPQIAAGAQRCRPVCDDGYAVAVGAKLPVAGVVVVATQSACQGMLTGFNRVIVVHDRSSWR